MKLEFYKNPHLVIPSIGSLLLLSLEFPVWFFVIVGGILIWRYLGDRNVLPLPKSWLTNLLALGLFFIMIGTYKTLFDRESSSLFFSCLCALKILEYKSQRDHLFIILLLMILIASKFLFAIDVWILPITTWLVYHLWLALISSRSSKGAVPWRTRFYFIKVALVSLPLTFLLYFMFPRLNSYLLDSRIGSGGTAVTGFGNEIRPGHISQLAQREDLIFRVELYNDVYVDRHQLYWRGLILRSTDGFRWFQGPPAEDIVLESSNPEPVNYKITMEPTLQRWMFPLDRPVLMSGSIPLLRTRDGLYQTALSFNSRTIVRGQSDLTLRLSPRNEEIYLKIPPQSSRMLELVSRIKKETHSHQEIVERIKQYFASQNFSYTLTPGEMDENNVDDFLFRAKKGYCEHFASGFAILARAAGVPARVVIGYQGAEFNSIGNFYSVKAQDAHAWNEFVNDKGEWTRIDIVDLVAPVRTELGTAEFLKLPENLRGLILKRAVTDEFFLIVAYDYLTTYIESLNFYWTQWLLDFNLDRQSELLKMLPLSFTVILFFFVAIVFIVFGSFQLWSHWSHRKNLVVYFYKRLLRWADHHGMPKESWEGPSSFVKRLQTTWPNYAQDFDNIVQHYINFTYGDRPISMDEIAKMTVSLHRVEYSTKAYRRHR